ncbi:MAG: HEPN domain-containing protein [Chloroflexi bacterium]|nr:HEPN domain-containing protein [Chloroflexota bacterium]
MPYERLLKIYLSITYSSRPAEIKQLLEVAHRDLITAEKNLADAPDWAYSIAYNSVLQASRALMLSDGFRPRGGEQHATVVEFIREKLGAAHTNQVNLFDQMRRKRHRAIYEIAGLVSKTEAEQAVAFAKEFVEEVSELITGQSKLWRDK